MKTSILLLLLLASCVSAYPRLVTKPPVAWYKLDEGSGTTTADSRGGVGGTLLPAGGEPTWTTGQAGGGAITFNGTTQNVSVSNPGTRVHEIFKNGGTVMAWVKLSATTGPYHIVSTTTSIADGAGLAGWAMYLRTGNLFEINHRGTSAQMRNCTFRAVFGVTSWQHVAVTYTAAVSVNPLWYVNGIPEVGASNSSLGGVANYATGDLSIGSTVAPSQRFPGTIDDVRLYDRILPAAEIALIASAGPHNAQSLSGWWRMDEGSGTTVEDETGNVTGTLLPVGGEPTWTTSPAGGALQFNGSTQNVSVASATTAMHQVFANGGTVAAWVYYDTLPASGAEACIVGTANTTQSAGWMLYGTATGNYQFSHNFATTPRTVVTAKPLFGGVAVPTGGWHFVTVTYTSAAATVPTLFIDGVTVPTTNIQTGSGAAGYATGDLSIGSATTATSLFLAGRVADVRLYPRILSPNDIASLYMQTGGTGLGMGTDNDSSLRAWFPMNEGSGTTLVDRSGNGMTSVINGSPTWEQGRYGSALRLNGTSQNVTVTDCPNLDLDPPFSVSVWAYKRSTATKSLLTKRNTTPTHGGLYVGYISGIGFATGSDNLTNAPARAPASNDINVWHHIVVVCPSGNRRDLYFDGTYVGTSSTNTISWNTFGDLIIGSARNATTFSPTTWWDGSIDDLRIFSRALGVSEIGAMYRSGAGAHSQ